MSAIDPDEQKVRDGKLTRFRVVMDFEVEVRGGPIESITVGRASAAVSREVRERLTQVLRKVTGRKSLGIPESGCGPQKSAYAYEGENPFVEVTQKEIDRPDPDIGEPS